MGGRFNSREKKGERGLKCGREDRCPIFGYITVLEVGGAFQNLRKWGILFLLEMRRDGLLPNRTEISVRFGTQLLPSRQISAPALVFLVSVRFGKNPSRHISSFYPVLREHVGRCKPAWPRRKLRSPDRRQTISLPSRTRSSQPNPRVHAPPHLRESFLFPSFLKRWSQPASKGAHARYPPCAATC